MRSSGSTLTFARKTTALAGGSGHYRRRGGGECYPHLPLAGAQIKVQAALKSLMDETREGRNLSEAGELDGNEGQFPVHGVLLLPQSALRTRSGGS